MTGDARVSRRRFLKLGAAGALLAGCDRFDAASWVSRERFDIDRRFIESIEELPWPHSPPVARDDVWSMLLISDIHCWEDEHPVTMIEVGEYLAREPVDLVFQIGDLADAGWPEEFDVGVEVLERLDLPFYGTMGNHDAFHKGWTSYRMFFGPSVYTLAVGSSLLVVTDTASGTLGGRQRTWLEQRLAEAEADHIFVLGHYPLWDSVSMGFSQLGEEEEVYDLLDLFRRYGVAAHFSGHTHRYAYTEVSGVKLYTVSSMKEGQPNHCGLRVDVEGDRVTYTRIPFTGAR